MLVPVLKTSPGEPSQALYLVAAEGANLQIRSPDGKCIVEHGCSLLSSDPGMRKLPSTFLTGPAQSLCPPNRLRTLGKDARSPSASALGWRLRASTACPELSRDPDWRGNSAATRDAI